jgi:S1-C subfamily serine protease
MTKNERRLLIALGTLALIMVVGSMALAGTLLVVTRSNAANTAATTAQSTTAQAPVQAAFAKITQKVDEAKQKAADELRAKQALAGRQALPLQAASVAQGADLTGLYEQVDPGVVSINVTEQVTSPFGGQGLQRGAGSGFVFDKTHIVTNNHVVGTAPTVEIVFYDGDRREGKVVGTDKFSDLAVVEVADMPATARPLPLVARFEDLKVGQPVIALGNPFGLENTMTYGIISALGRIIPANPNSASGMNGAQGPSFSIPQAIQTDAPVNPGNSGGPLLNLQGEIVGINAQINTTNVTPGGTPGNSGVAFAIPASIVQKVVPSLINGSGYDWSYLGVTGSDIDLDIAKANKLASTRGAYIESVVAGGPSANLLKGSTNTQAQTDQIQPSDSQSPDNPQAPNGMQIIPIPNPRQAPAQAQQLVTPQGGDVITSVDGQPVKSFTDLLTYVALQTVPGQTINLTVLRDGQPVTVAVKVGSRPK